MTFHGGTGELLGHTDEQDQALAAHMLDERSVTAWREAAEAEADKKMVLGAIASAYYAGAYSLKRHMDGVPGAMDLAIGASIIDPFTGRVALGFARDKEFGNPDLHAEGVSLENAEDADMSIAGLTMAVTLETCIDCAGRVHGTRRISRVTYTNHRHEVSNLDLIKHHPESAPDFIRQEREKHGQFNDLEFFWFPSRAIAAATLELHMPFKRNRDTEVVEFDPVAAQTGRFRNFLEGVEADLGIDPNRGPQLPYPMLEPDEVQVIASHFTDLVSSF